MSLIYATERVVRKLSDSPDLETRLAEKLSEDLSTPEANNMNLRFVILPKKVLQDGRHRIRLSISHNGDTRYFMTDYYLSSPKSLVNGEVSSKISGAKEMNLKLRQQKDRIEEAYHSIDGAEFFSCAEVVEMIKRKLLESKPKTIHEIFEEVYDRKALSGRKKNTMFTYKQAKRIIADFFPPTFMMQSLTEIDILRLKEWMSRQRMKKAKDKREGYSNASIEKILTKLKAAYMYAVKRKYFTPNLEIWDDIKIPVSGKRDCEMSVEDLRRFRDAPLDGYRAQLRDVFMLSFYLCGMNLIDIYKVDFSGDTISYMRTKTEGRRNNGEMTTFSLQPEAREILDKYTDETGHFCIRGGLTKRSLERSIYEYFPKMKVEFGFTKQFIFYSARHTFGQFCHELGVPDSIHAYCIGDAPKAGSLDFYRTTTKMLADKWIRKIFDFVASTKTLEEALAEL